MATAPSAARNYVFTINFPCVEHRDGRLTFPTIPRLLDFANFPSWITYCAYQLEVTFDEQTGKANHHFQGYLECRGKKSMKQLHEIEGLERAHFEIRRGSQQQAIAYATKTDDETYLEGPWTHGDPKAQGQRNDLLDVKEKIDKKRPISEVQQDHFATMIRYGKALKEYKRTITTPRNFKSKVYLFIGPPGKGKSTLMKLIARQLGSWYKVPAKKGSGLYFDDYDGQDVMILDEFDGSVMPPTFFNGLCDEHEFVLTVHGGAGHQMVSPFIFIGSNYLPRQWWKNRNTVQLQQTTRRIDVVFKVGFSDPPHFDHSGFQQFGPNIQNTNFQ